MDAAEAVEDGVARLDQPADEEEGEEGGMGEELLRMERLSMSHRPNRRLVAPLLVCLEVSVS